MRRRGRCAGWQLWQPLLILPAVLLCLAGCTVLGPDYDEPDIAWLAQWQPDLYGQLSDDAAGDDLAAWWQRFDDPVLTRLVDEVLAANPSLIQAGLRVLEARARLTGAEALRLPQQQQLRSSAAYLRQRRSDGLLPASDDSFGSYDASLVAGWELDFWGRFERGVQSADAAFFASVAQQRDLQVLLIAQTVDLYYALRTTELRTAIARKNADIQKRSFEITTRLFESGQQAELDLQQARTQYLATLATIPDLQRRRTQLRNALAVLLARPPAPLAALAGSTPDLPTVDPVAISDVPAALILRRPDVRAAAWQAGAQSAQIGVATAELYPAISLLGSFGWSGDSLSLTRDGTTFAVGPSLRWNIFDYGRIRANIRVQDARLQQALVAFDAAVLGAAREVDDAAIAVIKTAEAAVILRESRQAAERALAIANRRYQEGYADFQRVLDAQRALFAQAEKELVNEGAHLAALVVLFRSLGGGWQSMTIEEIVPEPIRRQMTQRSNWGGLLDAAMPEDPGTAGTRGKRR